MSKLLDQIHEYVVTSGAIKPEDLDFMDHQSVYLAMEIAIYAHRNQYRINGHRYIEHPFKLLENYRQFVGIIEDDPFCIDIDIMDKYNIPYWGVQEVCLLHDVIEDTELTMDDIESLFNEMGFDTYFEANIKHPLSLITHDKSMPHDLYLIEVLQNPVSSIVKMCDFYDNLNPLTLDKCDGETIKRSESYFNHMIKIEKKYHFIENCKKYRDEFKSHK